LALLDGIFPVAELAEGAPSVFLLLVPEVDLYYVEVGFVVDVND
jgi:hypothetical protein